MESTKKYGRKWRKAKQDGIENKKLQHERSVHFKLIMNYYIIKSTSSLNEREKKRGIQQFVNVHFQQIELLLLYL